MIDYEGFANDYGYLFFPQEKKTNLTRIKYDFTAISEITSQMTIALRKKLAGV